jgi:hypothetical protein
MWEQLLECTLNALQLLLSHHSAFGAPRRSSFRVISIVLLIVSECANHARYSGTMGFSLTSIKKRDMLNANHGVIVFFLFFPLKLVSAKK